MTSNVPVSTPRRGGRYTFPAEDFEDGDEGVVGQLNLSLHGTRDAAQGWEATYAAAMAKLGFHRGRSSPCVFHHPSRNMKCVVHGDDFFSEGLPVDLAWFEKAILDEVRGLEENGKISSIITQLSNYTTANRQSLPAAYSLNGIVYLIKCDSMLFDFI